MTLRGHRYMTMQERLDLLVRKSCPESCWWFIGKTSTHGYGLMSRHGKQTRAHRVALELWLGRPLSPGMNACHMCDNPGCCNPRHLFEGTRKDNMQDCQRKGRMVNPPKHLGEAHPGHTLTTTQVQDIRDRARKGQGPYNTGNYRALALEYGVSRSLVSLIVRRKLWR